MWLLTLFVYVAVIYYCPLRDGWRKNPVGPDAVRYPPEMRDDGKDDFVGLMVRRSERMLIVMRTVVPVEHTYKGA